MISIIDKIDIHIIRKEIENLPEGRIALQGVNSSQDPYYGTGATKEFTHSPQKKMREQEEEFIHPLFDIPYINELIKKHKMFRTRIMIQEPFACYSIHRDFTPRIHIPVYTNNKCLFILEDVIHRLKDDGSVYSVNTTLDHTAMNGSDSNRIHIVGNIHANS